LSVDVNEILTRLEDPRVDQMVKIN
jgi:hypothetical protein